MHATVRRSRNHREHALSSLATILPAAAGEGEGFHAPTIADFFPAPVLFDGTFLEVNRLQIVRLIAALTLVIVMLVIARRATLVPGRAQNVVEMLLAYHRWTGQDVHATALMRLLLKPIMVSCLQAPRTAGSTVNWLTEQNRTRSLVRRGRSSGSVDSALPDRSSISSVFARSKISRGNSVRPHDS